MTDPERLEVGVLESRRDLALPCALDRAELALWLVRTTVCSDASATMPSRGKAFVLTGRGEFLPKGLDDPLRLYEVMRRQ